MREWVLARRAGQCGRCLNPLKLGEPMLEIRTERGARFARCRDCGKRMFGEDPPADIHGRVAPQPSLSLERAPRRPLFAAVGSLASRFVDLKARQIARDPGEEG